MEGDRPEGPSKQRTDSQYALNIHNRVAFMVMTDRSATPRMRQDFRDEWFPRLCLIANAGSDPPGGMGARTLRAWASKLVQAWYAIDAGDVDVARGCLSEADGIRRLPRGHG